MALDPITVEPLGGLCNRMRAIASGYVLAQRSGRPLRVVWRLNNALNCPFERLFEPLPYDHSVEQVAGKPPGPTSNAEVIGRLVTQSDVDRMVASQVDWLELVQREPIHVVSWLDFYRHESGFDMFRPVPTLLDIVSHLAEALGHNAIGVHIRRTDHQRAMAYSDLDDFVHEMRKQEDSGAVDRFYLATDDAAAEEEILRRIDTPIIQHKIRSRNRNEAVAIEDAVVDLYTLASTASLIGSWISSFSLTAASIGRIPITFAPRSKVGAADGPAGTG